MTRRATKPQLHALLYVEQDHSVIELVAEIQRAVVSAVGYEYLGTIELRAHVNRDHAAAFGHRVVLNSVNPELGELRAAVRKIERMQQRMRKIDNEQGEAPTFAEYVRRGLQAAGVGIVHVARDAAGRPRNASNYITVRADDDNALIDTAARLEAIALMLFGRRVEAA
ncbi:hypothetical protein [Burkholderia cenocepacia]|uniref:hypothetical protein n=1 Tax=Burkholderia cenocepacia TaxID=95486 RepID=UPI002ABE3178|nr:hypothetical protein [Burkholderia cenocepacia]